MIMKTLHTIYTNFAKRLVMSLMVLMTVGVGSVLGAEEVMFPNNGSTFNSSWSKSTRTARQTYAASTAAIQLMGQNSGIYGEIYSNNAYTGISAISVKATASNSVSLTLYYSTNKSTWTELSSISLTKSTSSYSSKSFTVTGIPSSAVYLKFRTSASSAYIYSVTVTTASGYAVTWDKNGRGNVSDVSKFPTTASSLTLQSLSATGYTNTGWKANVDVKNGSTTIIAGTLIANSTTVTLSQATTFTAQWTPKQVTITWNANGGNVTPSTSNYIYDGSSVTLPTPTRDGYNFKGWYTSASGGTQITDIGTNNKPASDVTYYAQWTEKDLTNYRTSCTTETIVTLDPNGGTISNTDGWTENGNGTYSKTHEGTEITLPTATKTNYIFGGWYNGETKYESIPSDIDESITLTAKWLEKQDAGIYWDPESVTVTIDADGNILPEFNNPNEIDGIEFSSSNPSVVAVDVNGVITLGSTGTTATVTITATFDGDAIYAAKEATCTLTVHPSNCRWVETEIGDIESGDEVVIAMTKSGYTWALNSSKGKDTYPPATQVSIENLTITSDVPNEIIWNISGNATDGYVFYPNGSATTWLYCTGSNNTVKVGTGTAKTFYIENNYLKNTQKLTVSGVQVDAYVGVSISTSSWRHYPTTTGTSVIADQTLKFYKKTCLPADEYWVNYNLSNVTCITNPIPSQIANDGEDLLLEFSANDGYKLPEQVSITMGGNTLPEEAFAWEAEEGILYIVPKDGITGDIVITVEGCELLAIPTKLKANNITSSSATLSWDEIDHATEYQVHITDDDDSTEDIITTTSNTYYEVTGLSSASEYLWGITPIASGYCGLTQEAEIFTTLDVYTVTFNSNGGTAVDPQTVDHGTKATKPANPTKTGYTFAGWYTEADAEFDFNTPIESATTLYAKWNANQYTITFSKQWGDGGTANATVTFNSNNFSVATIDLPTRGADYKFGGYYTETGGAGLQIVDAEGIWQKNKDGYLDANGNWIKAESVTLYAKWTKIHTITWVVNNNTETPHHTSTALDGSTIDALPTPPADDLFEDCEVNAFVGWSTDNIGLEPDATAPTDLFKTLSEAQSKIGAINGDKKFYAVYANASNGADSYKLATTLEDLFDGQTVIIAKDNGALEKDNNTIDKVNISPDGNGNLSNVTDNIKWTLEASDTHWKLKNNGGYLGVTSTANQTAVSVTETNNVWQIAKSAATGDYFYICQQNTTIGLQYFNNQWQIYSNNSIASSTNFTLKIYVPNVSNYITRCTALPDPVWGGATIDKTEISVNCGETSSANGAAQISFPKATNYNLYKDITVEVTSGNFIIASSRDGEYTTSVTLTPTQSGTNVGTLDGKYVYVRAVAPPMSSDQLTGTITISGKQIATQVINVTATVTCNEYTLTFNDCGDTQKITDFAGTSVEEMEPWAEICSEPVQYVFDGWATEPVTNGAEGYEKVDFSTFTMPNNNTTILYAVYRYAEEGGEPVNGFVKVTEALSNWSGDYVIVNETAKKAIGNAYNNNNNNTLTAIDVTIENDKVVSPSESIIWQISKNGEYYTMYNATAEKYAYITQDKSEAAGLDNNPKNLRISFNNSIAKIYGETITRCFSYYSTNTEWRVYSIQTYSTGALYRLSNKTIRYTSSLVCGSIEAENAIVTSTVGQIVKVNVPITLNYSDAASITGTSDNEAFTVVTKNDVTIGESNIEVHYKPTAYVNTANQEETANITLTTSNGATTTFNVTGRCLPENFAIVAKVGNNWFALPSQGLNSETTPVGYPVEVDNNDSPTAVTSLPTKAEWELRNVYKVNGLNDRFAANGENLVFVNAENKTLYANNGNANIQTYAEYTNYAENNPERYEWVPTTTDLTNYTLKNVGRDKDLSINVNATFGTHASNIASNNLRFLPINATYNPFDMQVVEWYPTKVLVQTEATLASVSATVGGVAVANPGVTKKGGKLYEISGLPLENNPTKILTISYDSYSCSKVIPIIISQDTKTVSDAPFSTLTKAIYNYSDLVVRDGAVLNITGAKNTPDKFVNVTIYPTAKIVVPENNQLSVYSLTFFGGIDDIYDGKKYTTNKYGVPQLSLKGTLGKTVTTMDYIMRVNLDQMYQVGVPYDVNLDEITYWDGSAIKLGDELYVSAYDGQARANLNMNNTWRWEVNFDEKVLEAGVGYTISAEPQVENDDYSILRMPMKSNISSGDTEASKQVPVIAYANQHSVQIADNHKGWNYLSNPYMTAISGGDADSKILLGALEYIDGSWELVNKEYRYVTIPHNDGEDYDQQKFSEATLLPFKSFFLQIAENGDLSFALASRQAAPARYLQQAADSREVEFEILLANATRSDNMGLLISEEYTPDYEINADLEKMIGSMSVYSIYNGYNLAYNAINPTNAHDWIPIGYSVPDVGEYTFSLDEDVDLESVEHIYLIDYETSEMTDLVEYEYTFQTSEKKNDARFAIQVRLSQKHDNTTTVLDNLNATDNKSSKFIYNEQLYILRNGNIYDATGKFVTTINK